MSHIGSKHFPIDQNIEIKQYKSKLYVKGKLGVSEMPNAKYVVQNEKGYIYFSQKNFWGTFQSISSNLIKGVTYGFRKRLKLVGLGYRCHVENNKLILKLGYSRLISFPIPKDIQIITLKPTLISIYGINKQKTNQIASKIRKLRMPEPYKGKGILYENEVVQLKDRKQ